ncbi:sugar efflux transporter [Actinacidiphila yeochonensis]|uniref:sugar efflux transporter n=1 Tax=Actinacidiphila yeochonensis TaxID=89050 RepID=UPI0007C819F1|nr:sugar efflux transporter [Actinacidiphila yeochonensis]
MLRDTQLTSLVGTTGLIGVGGAMVTTSSSLFLSDAIKATPLMVGFFFTGRALSEIVCEMVVAVMSDRIGNRRPLLALCALLSGLGAFSFYCFHNYYVLFAAVSVLLGIGSACFSQLFAFTREFAETRVLNAVFFNAALRAVTSVAWIAGPPLAFLLISHSGFDALFLTATALYLLAALIAWRGLPDLGVGDRPPPQGNPYRGIGRRMGLLMGAVLLLMVVSSIYQINIALYVTKTLHLATGFTGILIGLAAGLEVPVMLYLGSRAERIGKWPMVIFAACCATLFFALLPLVHTAWGLLLLQLPNAAWTAVVMSIPVTILQDHFTGERVGLASALYASAFKTGIFVGGAVTGVVTEWAGYTDVFWVCAALAAAAAVLLVCGRNDGTDSSVSGAGDGAAVQRGGADLQQVRTAAPHAGLADEADAAG